MARFDEKHLDQELDRAFRENPVFVKWFLSSTRFAERGAEYLWSRCDNPWGTIDFKTTHPETGDAIEVRKQGETDVLVVLLAADGERLAVHVENKIDAHFTEHQPEMYEQRAAQWKGLPQYQNYTDFITVLTAPERYKERHRDKAELFQYFISHEAIATHLPDFARYGMT